MIDGAVVEVELPAVAEDTEEGVEAEVTAEAVALARLRRWGPTGRVVWVFALALTLALAFDVDLMDLAFAILAVVALRWTVGVGGGDDPIVAIVEALLSDEVVAVVDLTSMSPADSDVSFALFSFSFRSAAAL
jgi:hypothetical protein